MSSLFVSNCKSYNYYFQNIETKYNKCNEKEGEKLYYESESIKE